MKYILNNSYCENFEKLSKAFLQKEPPEVFYKKRYSYRFCKIHKKAPVPGVPEYLYACNFIETLIQLFSNKFCKILNNTFFKEHLWMTASVTLIWIWVRMFLWSFSYNFQQNYFFKTPLQNYTFVNARFHWKFISNFGVNYFAGI